MTSLSDAMVGLMVAVVASFVLIPAVLMIMRRRDPLGLCLSLLGSAAVTSLVGVAAVITRTPARPWFLVGVPLVYIIGMIRLYRLHWATRWRSNLDRFGLIGAAVVGLSAVIFLFRAPVAWDARSIWFFHASWFAHPATAYTESPLAGRISHMDYPPLTASFGAFAWLFGDPRSDWIVQSATGLLTLSAIGILSIIVARSMDSALGRALVAAVTAFTALAIIRGNSLDGYVDGLASVLVSILVVAGFRRDDPPLVMITAVALALVKNEGYVFLVVVILPLYLLRRRSVLPLIPGLSLGLTWAVAIRMTRPALEPWIPFNVSPWSPDFAARLQTVAGAVLSDVVLTIAIVSWIGALLITFARKNSRHILVVLLGMGIVATALTVVIVSIYLATSRDLDWHLATSLKRLLMHPSMVLTVGAIYGIVAGWGAPIGRDQSRNQVVSAPLP